MLSKGNTVESLDFIVEISDAKHLHKYRRWLNIVTGGWLNIVTQVLLLSIGSSFAMVVVHVTFYDVFNAISSHIYQHFSLLQLKYLVIAYV